MGFCPVMRSRFAALARGQHSVRQAHQDEDQGIGTDEGKGMKNRFKRRHIKAKHIASRGSSFWGLVESGPILPALHAILHIGFYQGVPCGAKRSAGERYAGVDQDLEGMTDRWDRWIALRMATRAKRNFLMI